MITPPRLPPRLRFLRLLLPVAALAGFLVVVMAAGLLVVGQFVGGGEDGERGHDVRGGDGRAAVGGRPADLRGARRGAAPDRGHDHRRRQGHGDPAAGLGGRPGHGDAGVADGHRRHDVAVDHDSLGVFQQRPSQGWGSPEQVPTPSTRPRTFLERLLTVPGWDTMPVTRAAQIVQRSAFPDAYAKWESLANSLVTDLAGVTGAIQECVPAAQAGPGPAAALPPGVARTAIEFATAETGKPYVWGATGPSSYDCSGLMLRAFQRAGIVLPRVSREQFNAGAHVAVEQAQPGDLLFWAYDQSDPDTIHHVAMYMGNGQMMEAQQTGVPLGTREVTWDEGELLPLATRPGTGSDRA